MSWRSAAGRDAGLARAMEMIMDGSSRTEAARGAGAGHGASNSVRLGIALQCGGLRGQGGSSSRWERGSPEGGAEVGPWTEAGPDLEGDGVTRRQFRDIVRKIEEAFGVAHTESGARITPNRRHSCVHPFRATCAEHGVGIAHVADRANAALMNEHLAPGAHGVILLDGAGWHRPGDLLVPPKPTLQHQTPYSPGLGPMELITSFLKSNRSANRVFRDVAALRKACRTGWQGLTANPKSSRNDPEQPSRRGSVMIPVLHCIELHDLRSV